MSFFSADFYKPVLGGFGCLALLDTVWLVAMLRISPLYRYHYLLNRTAVVHVKESDEVDGYRPLPSDPDRMTSIGATNGKFYLVLTLYWLMSVVYLTFHRHREVGAAWAEGLWIGVYVNGVFHGMTCVLFSNLWSRNLAILDTLWRSTSLGLVAIIIHFL